MLKRLDSKYLPMILLVLSIVAILCLSRHAGGDKASWIETFAWPNGVTAWALLLTLMVIAWQSTEARDAAKATRDAAQATLKQANIQAAGMRQWLDVELIASDTGETPLTDEFGKFVASLDAKLHFKAVNNSPYPLTVKKAQISISRNRYDGKMKWESFVIEETAILPPGGRGSQNTYHFFIRLRLEGAGVESYARDNFFASIVGNVSFEPVIGESIIDQSFGSIGRCGPSGASFTGYWSKEAVSVGDEEYEPER